MKLITSILTAAVLAMASPAHADPSAPSTLAQGFDDVTMLNGWVMVNRSRPSAGQSWFQGNPGIFEAFSGAPDSYIGANYLATSDESGSVDLWLITPVLSISSLTEISYALRSAGAGYADQVGLWYGEGSGTDPNWFTLIQHHGAVPGDWTQMSGSANFTGEGRFAFRFTGWATAINYVGLDSVQVTAVPEPATYIMLCIGLAVLFGFRNSRAAAAIGAIAMSSAAFGGEPPQSGMVVVRDPQTGQLRAPTEAEFTAMAELVSSLQAGTPAAPPQTIVRADGTVQRSMGAEGMSYSVLTRGKDGKLSIDCIQGDKASQRAASAKEKRHETE